MKVSAISSLLFLTAAPFVAAADTTSVSTTTITKTLIRVSSVTATPSSSAASVSATSTPLVSSTQAAASATKTGGAVNVGAGMPAVLVAGSFALIMGVALSRAFVDTRVVSAGSTTRRTFYPNAAPSNYPSDEPKKLYWKDSSALATSLIAMDNEIPLPPPRRIRHRSPARAAGPSPAGSVASSFRRARRLSRFDDRSSQPSSDPALFSSDDIPASGLENYHASMSAGAGRKRRYRGTWWGEQVADPKRKRADFKEKRNVDSGVWMGSDESVAESLLPSEDASTWGEDLLKTVLDPRAPGKSPIPPMLPSTLSKVQPRPMVVQGPVESEEHQYARAVINDCLEKGEDSVDLGNINMRYLPRDLLRPLQHLTKLPSIQEPPISENVYSSLQPFLRLYLSNNSLTTLHASELFELKDLKVLSVRNNKLTRIPEAIRNLTALQVLNVSVNRLDELPWELIELIQKGELKHFTACPNPFASIDESEIAEWHCRPGAAEDEYSTQSSPRFREYDGTPPDEAWAAIHVASGPVTRLDMEGRRIEHNSPSSAHASRAPSLREVALRGICRLPGLEYLTDEELLEFPAMVIPLLSMAREVRLDGARYCSVCHHEFIVPRAEWTEWWDCTPHENGMKMPRPSGDKLRPLPFKRVGCSWACVPAGPCVE
ncbi:hypothetical protein N7462_002493 [Penicillium macrosclerotiorum]|uniref:uncharacterized protein n=1 Tax=Penicillium macrosclerotiorum TaxID=303699 RepID=UPI002546796C|nr:uncharacterized protein N7462_002493 [Penicillium macrosclerotiorum]KAJ5693070.1 hypothetical protein N7462_002493 [Penicillium macrosclerotiorum]